MQSWLKRLTLGAAAAGALLALAIGMPTAQPKEVVIGVLYPLTGPTAQAGIDSKAAVDVAVGNDAQAQPTSNVPAFFAPNLLCSTTEVAGVM